MIFIALTIGALSLGQGPLLPLHGARSAEASSHTRVLLVDIDDVGFDLLRDAPTPTLDWIEANGRFFTSFTTAPMCTPTRAMVTTGAYGSHPAVLIGDTIRGNSPLALPVGPLISLPALVTASGRTAVKIGKWHLAPRSQPDHPRAVGWQHYAGVPLNIGPQGSYSTFRKVIDGTEFTVTGRYLTTDETDDGIRAVDAGVDLVSVSYHAAHDPFHEPPAHLHSITPILTSRDLARAMLQALDREFGRLLAAAMARDYTIIIFSDNGTAQTIGGRKGSLFDPAIVTPMWVVGPGVVPGLDDSRIGAVDIYATIADLLAIPAQGPLRGPHSRSFLPALRGAPAEQRWTYAERFFDNGVDPHAGMTDWRRAIRGERYKFADEPATTGERFHDLWIDPTESVNLLAGPPLSPMAQAALEHFRDVFARL